MIRVGNEFPLIEAAHEAISRYILNKANYIKYISQIKPAIYSYVTILSASSEFEHQNQRRVESLSQNSTHILVRLLLIIIQSPLITTIKAHAYLRQFWAINACHTKS
jgi:hypothetical protein